ncbi:MAG: hypothetical protein UW92_C0018G0021 [Candidatus Jorgensenbacteria bacterium GW2011_GWA2_45_13]|uniref:Uncharacterized protein n=1 Tax=Candidatus Jorgensenbacteria bacterium GW2011_GWA2_45_13 TaxID=1618662 RepID=A0A0G1L5E9_9BACT|nr:MAG: hypothetical protein UW92_C0018G0021 [Candidatus Jorgensenbacteria bacterium GW2011_GWA2_45_13]
MVLNTKLFLSLLTISTGFLILFNNKKKNVVPKKKSLLDFLEEKMWENGDAAC